MVVCRVRQSHTSLGPWARELRILADGAANVETATSLVDNYPRLAIVIAELTQVLLPGLQGHPC